MTYIYDGDGRRAAKVCSKLYRYGSGREILAETDSSGTTTAEYLFVDGRRVAMLPTGTNAQYYTVSKALSNLAQSPTLKKAERSLHFFNGTLGLAKSNCAGGGGCLNALGMAGTAVLAAGRVGRWKRGNYPRSQRSESREPCQEPRQRRNS